MFFYILLIEYLHLPAQELSQLRADDFPFRLSWLSATRCASWSRLFVRASSCAGAAWSWGRKFINRLALTDRGSWKIVSFVNGFNRTLKAAEESLSTKEGGV